MDRRSWLWRRKSAEKSPGGETESTGSVSSHSERFFDDQVCTTHSSQSPEDTSKAASNDEDANEIVKTLKDNLTSALLDITAKEDLVKQHAKVAEEAVSGWEKAENEVSVLKKKLEATNLKNSALEARLGHLDQALKECVRQLRLARDEREEKIQEVVAKKTHEWESLKSVLDSQLDELRLKLQRAKMESLSLVDSDSQPKLEAAVKENSTLRLELQSQAKKLETGIRERDLCIKAAETASKQHLESMKRVSKLEAECRRLKAIARKALQSNEQKSLSASSVYVESYSDSQSINLEPNDPFSLETEDSEPSTIVTEHQFRNEKSNLMGDFLEMERLAALPDLSSRGGSHFSAAFEAAIKRTSELEEKLEKVVTENEELEMALNTCQNQLEESQSRLFEAEMELQELRTRLFLADESKRAADEQVEATQTKREMVESQLRVVKNEVNTLLGKVGLLEEEVQNERAVSAERLAKCEKIEDELLSMKLEAENPKEPELQRFERTRVDINFMQEKELALAAEKFAECQTTMASLSLQLKCLVNLEDFLMESESEHRYRT